MSAVLRSQDLANHESRYNIYTVIHKGLRGYMTDTLHRWGRMDVADDCERAQAIEQVRALLNMCRNHLQHENDFVHPAIEKARPGASARIAREHLEHVTEIEYLEERVLSLQSVAAAERAVLARRIYRELSLFVADNLTHMVVEETEHHDVLSVHYTDEQVLAIEHQIVGSLPPEESFAGLRWMIPHMNATERAAMLGGMKRGAPPEAFKLVMELAREALSQRDFYKLEKALA